MDKVYYPCCRENNCNGFLRFKINDNFSIDYECDNNEEHKRNKIYFKTFERFYLREDTIVNCSKCNISLPNNYIFKCNICKNTYCNLCFKFDTHIKEDIVNLNVLISSCSIHKMNLTHYCTDCNLNVCIYCIKNDEDEEHEGHNIKSLLDYIPSITQINDLIDSINLKEKSNIELIDKINNWEKKIISKAEELKKNLKDEIDFLKKIVFNFSQYIINYNYISNFYYLDNYIHRKNENLEKFRNSFNFQDETKYLLDFFNNNNKIKEKGVKTDIIKLKEANL